MSDSSKKDEENRKERKRKGKEGRKDPPPRCPRAIDRLGAIQIFTLPPSNVPLPISSSKSIKFGRSLLNLRPNLDVPRARTFLINHTYRSVVRVTNNPDGVRRTRKGIQSLFRSTRIYLRGYVRVSVEDDVNPR